MRGVEVLSDRYIQNKIQNSIETLNNLIWWDIKKLFNPSKFMKGFLINISKDNIGFLLEWWKINIDIVENNDLKRRVSFVSLEDIKSVYFDLWDIDYDEINIYPVYE